MFTTSAAVESYGWNEELQSAHAVQQHLLARHSKQIVNADCSAACRQANAVGGDFYDFLQLSNGELGIAIGDVAGKGMAAALWMANLQATLRAEARREPPDVAGVVETVNREFHAACFEQGYATLFYAVFDPESGVLRYVNAGHNPPLVRRADGSTEWLETGGAPVGMFHAWPYEEGSVQLNPGDAIVAYTDGIVEAQNKFGEDWGTTRLAGVVDGAGGETAAQMTQRVWNAVDRFAAGNAQRDDMTVLVVRV